MRYAPLVVAAALVFGCSDAPRAFTPDAATPVRDAATSDLGPRDAAATDVPAVYDAGPAVDRPAVQSTHDFVLPGAPDDSPTRFAGAEDPSMAPTFVYPADGTFIPPNLPSFEVHFRPGAGQDLFQVAFIGSVTVARFYTRCMPVNGGCVVSLDTDALGHVAEAALGRGTVSVQITGTRSPEGAAMGGAVGRSATITLGVTRNPLRGAVYWWASSGSIVRYDMGTPGAHAERYLQGDPINCVGCHVLSRDGSRIWAGRFIPGILPTPILDVPTRNAVGASFAASFGTFSPDDTRFLASNGSTLYLMDGATGAAATGLAPNFPGSMPDWSPSGAQVVFARPHGFGGPTGHSGAADLMLMPWTGSAFGAATTLLASSDVNNYYPAFSPDNLWVLFNRSPDSSYNNLAAQLWVTRADGGAPTRLAHADDGDGNGDSWPKWTPFVESTGGEVDEPLLWFTFSSRRDYGLRLQQQGTAADMRVTQLWMASFRPNTRNTDPSTPAFWLPFQNLDQGNHIAQWVPSLQRQMCGDGGACAAGETCIGGRCIGAPP